MNIIKDCEFKDECPICRKKTTGDAVLVGISGTEYENNIQAKLFHIDCISLIYYDRTTDENNILAQLVRKWMLFVLNVKK